MKRSLLIVLLVCNLLLLSTYLISAPWPPGGGGGRPNNRPPAKTNGFIAGMELRVRALDEYFGYSIIDANGNVVKYKDSTLVELRLIRYRDCEADPAKNALHWQPELCVLYSKKCCELIIDTVRLDTSKSDKYATPICPYNPEETKCENANSSRNGYKLEVFLDTFFLPCKADDWRIGHLFSNVLASENFLTSRQHVNGVGNVASQPQPIPYANYVGRTQTANQPSMGYTQNPNEHCPIYIEIEKYNNYVESGKEIDPNTLQLVPRYVANTTPLSAANPLIFQCQNRQRKYNMGYFDVDNNRMEFELTQPLRDAPFDFFDPIGSKGRPVMFQAPYNYLFPIGSGQSSLSVDKNTGEIEFVAGFNQTTATGTPVGKYKVAIGIDEFDNNSNKIGHTMRDLVFTIINSPNCDNPNIPANRGKFYEEKDSIVNFVNCAIVNNGSKDVTVEGCPGTTIQFDVKGYIDTFLPSASLFFAGEMTSEMLKTGGTVNPAPVDFRTDANGMYGSARFSWTIPANIPPGNYPVVFQIRDCIDGYILSETRIIYVRVNSKTKLTWEYLGFVQTSTSPFMRLPSTKVAYTCGNAAPNLEMLFTAYSSSPTACYTWNAMTSGIAFTAAPCDNITQPIITDATQDQTVCVVSDQYCQNTDCLVIKAKPNINASLELDTLDGLKYMDSCYGSPMKLWIKNLTAANCLFDWQGSIGSEFLDVPSPLSSTANVKLIKQLNDYRVFIITTDTCIYPLRIDIPTVGLKPRARYQTDREAVCPNDPIRIYPEDYPFDVTTSICGKSDFSKSLPGLYTATFPGNLSNIQSTPKVFTATVGIDKSRTQFIYKAKELIKKGFKRGKIKSISFSIDGIVNPLDYNFVQIFAKCFNKDDLSNYTFEDTTYMMKLYENGSSVTLKPGWNDFQFINNGFTWDGETDLIFDVQTYCNNVASGTPSAPVYNDNLTPYISIIGQYGKGNAGFLKAGIVGGSLRPNIRWTYEELDETHLKYKWRDITVEDRGRGIFPDSTTIMSDSTMSTTIKSKIPRPYEVAIRDSSCIFRDTIVALVDTNYKISATPDTITKCPGDQVPLWAEIGHPERRVIDVKCGNVDPYLENRVKDSCRMYDSTFMPILGSTTSTVGTAVHSPFGGVTGATVGNPTTDKRVQILYTAAELQANPTMRPGYIRSLGFELTTKNAANGSTLVLRNFTVRMRCVSPSMTVLGSSFMSATGFKEVFYADQFSTTSTVSNPYTEIPLQSQFGWDSTQGIVVDICFDNYTGTAYNPDVVRATNVGAFRYLYRAVNSGDSLGCAFTTGTRDNIRPNIRFNVCKPTVPASPLPMGLQWAPPNQISNTLIHNPIIFNENTAVYHVKLDYLDTNYGANKIACTVRDTVLSKVGRPEITFNPNPAVSCQGATIPLVAGVRGTPSSLFNFTWDTTDKLGNAILGLDHSRLDNPNQRITPPNQTMYFVRAENAANPNCWSRDSIIVYIQNLQTMPDIGGAVLLCPGESAKVTIPRGTGYKNPLWYYNNKPLDTGYQIELRQVGSYYVMVDSGACRNTSLVKNVTMRTPDTVRLPKKNFVICEGDSAYIYYDVSNYVANPIWNTGATTLAIKPNQAGIYFLVNPRNQFNCLMVNPDVAEVKITSNPAFRIENDTLCMSANEKVVLKPIPYDPSASYTWEPTGITASSLTVYTPNTYTVTRKKGNCEKIATAVVMNDTIGRVDLGINKAVCCDEVVTLDANPYHRKYTKYRWSTGDKSQLVYTTPNASGQYIVEAFRANGCRDTGSIYVDAKCAKIQVRPDRQEIILGESNNIKGKHNSVKASNIRYEWIPSANFNKIINGDSLNPIARPYDTGDVEYVLVMTIRDDSYNPSKICVENAVARFKVSPNAIDSINAFSPNGDGLNETFYPQLTGIVKMKEFKVYNRFGQLLHDDPFAPWDGKYRGAPQPVGVYVGLLSFEFEEPLKPIVTKRRQINITLVR